MPGIVVMAVLTILVTALLCVAFLNHLTHADRRFYWLVLIGLPLSLIVNRWIKIPVITGLAAWLGIPLKLSPETPVWFVALLLFNASIFEEAIKVLPTALPVSRNLLSDASHSLSIGLALGLGFGLGEAAYLAYGIAQSLGFAGLPWHMFTGFASERLIVTFGHGFLTSIAVFGVQRGGRKALYGYLSAVGLHAMINLGPILFALKLIPEIASSMASYLCILAAFVVFQRNLRTARILKGIRTEEIVYFERR